MSVKHLKIVPDVRRLGVPTAAPALVLACGVSRTLRVASAFASGGMLRTDVCMKPRGHKGEHQA